MRHAGRFVAVLFMATCFVMAGCIPDEFLPPDCPSCNCPSCPRCPECPECEVCEECQECPECPEFPENSLAGEYVFYSLTMMDPERGTMTFPFSEHGCEIGLDGNVSMSEEDDGGSNDFLLHLMFVVRCPDTPPELMGEHILSGIYLFDGVNLTVMGSDMFMWFEYNLSSEDDVDYLELVPYGLGEDDENNIVDITLERVGEAGDETS